MLLNDIETNFETHKVLMYGSDGNKVIKRNVDMQHIKGNFYRGKNIKNPNCSYESCELFAFYPEINIGIELRTLPVDDEVDKIIEVYKNSAFVSTEKFIECMDRLVENGGFIGSIHIELAKYIKPENVSVYQKAKIEFNKRKMLENQKLAEQREKEEKQYCEEKNKQAEEKISETIEKFKSDGEIQNSIVTFYKRRYDSSSYSIINHIARKYNIKIPLKVQGWINEHLVTIRIKGGEMDGYTYHRGHKSTTIYNYINALIKAINTEVISE